MFRLHSRNFKRTNYAACSNRREHRPVENKGDLVGPHCYSLEDDRQFWRKVKWGEGRVILTEREVYVCWGHRGTTCSAREQIHLLSPCPAATAVMVNPNGSSCGQTVHGRALRDLITNSCRAMCAHSEIDQKNECACQLPFSNTERTDKNMSEIWGSYGGEGTHCSLVGGCQPWRQRRYDSPKSWLPLTRPHGATITK
jgi:hypothetical protein